MTFDELILEPPDAIDYAKLESSRLQALATQNDEPYIATNALAELRGRRGPEVREAVERIVSGGKADRFLVAFALATLFEVDLARAIEIATAVAPQTTDPKILGAMMGGVLAHLEHFEAGTDRELVDAIVERARALRPDEFTDADEWSDFLERFGSAIGIPTRGVMTLPPDVEAMLESNRRWRDSRGTEGHSAYLAFEAHPGIDLSDAVLTNATMYECDLSDAILDRADVRSVLAGGMRLTRARLRGAVLARAQLQGVDFTDSDATGAEFDRADLARANFDGARLVGADFFHAMCLDATFRGADLSGANLAMTVLDGAHLTGANLTGADLDKAHIDENTQLTGVILDGVKVTKLFDRGRPVEGDAALALLRARAGSPAR